MTEFNWHSYETVLSPQYNDSREDLRMQRKQKKRMGRPPTGKGLLLGVRVHPNFLKALDEWREKQKGRKLSRPEAIRQLSWLQLLAQGAKREP
jgi:hypothetical protein